MKWILLLLATSAGAWHIQAAEPYFYQIDPDLKLYAPFNLSTNLDDDGMMLAEAEPMIDSPQAAASKDFYGAYNKVMRTLAGKKEWQISSDKILMAASSAELPANLPIIPSESCEGVCAMRDVKIAQRGQGGNGAASEPSKYLLLGGSLALLLLINRRPRRKWWKRALARI